MKAVILAGGRGTRLAPYTTILPKPLMPLGNHPVLEIIICQLRKCGFTDITMAVGYLRHLLEAYFEHGERLAAVGRRAAGDEALVENHRLVVRGDQRIVFHDEHVRHTVMHHLRPYVWKLK